MKNRSQELEALMEELMETVKRTITGSGHDYKDEDRTANASSVGCMNEDITER